MFDKKKMGGGVLLAHVSSGGEIGDTYEDEPFDRKGMLKDVASEFLKHVHANDAAGLAECFDALLVLARREDEAEDETED